MQPQFQQLDRPQFISALAWVAQNSRCPRSLVGELLRRGIPLDLKNPVPVSWCFRCSRLGAHLMLDFRIRLFLFFTQAIIGEHKTKCPKTMGRTHSVTIHSQWRSRCVESLWTSKLVKSNWLRWSSCDCFSLSCLFLNCFLPWTSWCL